MTDYVSFKGYLDPNADRSELKDSRGALRTESLFVETMSYESGKNYTPVYSLRDYDNKGYLSAYQVYMNSVDETEAALKLVGSMAHWRKLCQLKWFMEGRALTNFEGIKQWREDMAARDATIAKRVMMEQCVSSNVSAARALNEVATGKKVRGQKPTKESIQEGSKELEADLDNIIELGARRE